MHFRQGLAAALLASTLALGACGETAEAPVEEVEGIAGLEVSNPRMVLAPVAGNPAAVYFDLDYAGDRIVTVSAAFVDGAEMTMIHEYTGENYNNAMVEAPPKTVKNGETLSFEPGGLHLMAMNVSPDLQPGGKTEVTLTIATGDKHSFEAEILAAGDER